MFVWPSRGVNYEAPRSQMGQPGMVSRAKQVLSLPSVCLKESGKPKSILQHMGSSVVCTGSVKSSEYAWELLSPTPELSQVEYKTHAKLDNSFIHFLPAILWWTSNLSYGIYSKWNKLYLLDVHLYSPASCQLAPCHLVVGRWNSRFVRPLYLPKAVCWCWKWDWWEWNLQAIYNQTMS